MSNVNGPSTTTGNIDLGHLSVSNIDVFERMKSGLPTSPTVDLL